MPTGGSLPMPTGGSLPTHGKDISSYYYVAIDKLPSEILRIALKEWVFKTLVPTTLGADQNPEDCCED